MPDNFCGPADTLPTVPHATLCLMGLPFPPGSPLGSANGGRGRAEVRSGREARLKSGAELSASLPVRRLRLAGSLHRALLPSRLSFGRGGG